MLRSIGAHQVTQQSLYYPFFGHCIRALQMGLERFFYIYKYNQQESETMGFLVEWENCPLRLRICFTRERVK